MKRVHFEDGIECQRSPPPAHTKEESVFGLSLNKKPKKKKMNGEAYVGGRGEEDGERKRVWKLRRWSKSRGHHTVVVENGGEGEEGRECGEAGEKKDREVNGSGTKIEDKSNEVQYYDNVFI